MGSAHQKQSSKDCSIKMEYKPTGIVVSGLTDASSKHLKIYFREDTPSFKTISDLDQNIKRMATDELLDEQKTYQYQSMLKYDSARGMWCVRVSMHKTSNKVKRIARGCANINHDETGEEIKFLIGINKPIVHISTERKCFHVMFNLQDMLMINFQEIVFRGDSSEWFATSSETNAN